MNCKITFIGLTLLLSTFVVLDHAVAQSFTEKPLVVEGSVVDGETLEDLSGVHVFVRLKYGAVTDIDGNFSLKAHQRDTIHLTRIGYESYSMILNDTLLTRGLLISMKRSARVLKEITISGTFQAQTIIVRPKLRPMKIDGVPEAKLDPDAKYKLGAIGAIASPATALYRSFSKRYKEEKKFHKIKKEQARQSIISDKVRNNLTSVLKINRTPIDEDEYVEFMDFCGLSERRVSESNDYDLILIVQECVERYHAYTYQKSLSDK